MWSECDRLMKRKAPDPVATYEYLIVQNEVRVAAWSRVRRTLIISMVDLIA